MLTLSAVRHRRFLNVTIGSRHHATCLAERQSSRRAALGQTTAGGRLQQCPEFAGPPIPSKHDHVLRRHRPYRGSPRLDDRAIAWPGEAGHLVAADTRAAPTRPLRQRARCPRSRAAAWAAPECKGWRRLTNRTRLRISSFYPDPAIAIGVRRPDPGMLKTSGARKQALDRVRAGDERASDLPRRIDDHRHRGPVRVVGDRYLAAILDQNMPQAVLDGHKAVEFKVSAGHNRDLESIGMIALRPDDLWH